MSTKWRKYITCKACSYVFIQDNYIKARVLMIVFSPISTHFYPQGPAPHKARGGGGGGGGGVKVSTCALM